MIDGLPTGERTTTFDINQEVTTPMPLSQEAEMMKRFSEIVAVAVSCLCCFERILRSENVLAKYDMSANQRC